MEHSVWHFKPHPALQDYIQHYTLRKIAFADGEVLQKIMPQRTVCSIEFFLNDPYTKFDYETGERCPFNTSTVRGIRTFTKYKIQLSGNFVSFTVRFHPVGMYRLLGVPMNYLTNQDLPLGELDILPADEIVDLLREAKHQHDYKKIVEGYFLSLLNQRQIESRIGLPATRFSGYKNWEIHSLSDRLNISIRQTERIFLNEIGISLRKLKQLHKFDEMVKYSISNPEASWTKIAHKFGFYDQPDLIKSFKYFLNTTPSKFNPKEFAF